MIQTIERLEEQLNLLEIQRNYWHMREVTLADQTAMATKEQSALVEQIHDLALTINQLKSSENPKSWFFRSWNR